MLSKTDLRREFRARLQEGDGAEMIRQTAALVDRVADFLRDQSGTWAAFQPTGFEPDIRPLFQKNSSIEWAYPRVVSDTRLEFRAVDHDSPMVLNKWGILEPDPRHSRLVEIKSLRGLLVPALGFDDQCNRLGRGGGFYDRLLAELNEMKSTAIKIGIALERQVSKELLPTEAFDQPVDWVVTESRAIRRGDVDYDPSVKSSSTEERKTS